MLTDLTSTGKMSWFVLAHGMAPSTEYLGTRCASKVDLYKRRMQERQRAEFKQQEPEMLDSASTPAPSLGLRAMGLCLQKPPST